jgi:o-succinylbenzoate synthase
VTAIGALTQREGLLLQLVTEGGRLGLGEAAPPPEGLGAANALSRIVADLAPTLIGRNIAGLPAPRLPEACAPDVAGALRAAVDAAVCDLLAQEQGLSVARLLSGAAGESVAVNALVTAVSNAPALARAVAEAGFGAVKLKVGMMNPESERRFVASVREAIGPDVKLRLDANGAWTAPQAVETLRVLEPYDIEYVEQPTRAGDIETLGRVQRAVSVDIAADEDVTDPAAAQRILDAGAARLLILKPQRLGGLRACRPIIDTATAAGVRCVVTTSIDTGIGTAAALHLAAALGGPYAHGLATLDLLEDDLILDPGLPIENGRMRLPGGPGLGVTLDEAALARYADGWHEIA